MFCMICGAENMDTAKFCIKCGQPLVKARSLAPEEKAKPPPKLVPDPLPPPVAAPERAPELPPPPETPPGTTAGSKIAVLAAVVAVVGFFLPWMTVSCGDLYMTMSGHDLAEGGVMQTSYGPSDPIPANPELYVVLGAAAIICLIFFVAFARRRIGWIETLLQMAVAGVGLWQVYDVMERLRAQYSDPNLGVQAEHGFWMTVFGLGGVILGSLLSVPEILRQRPRSRSQRRPAGYRREQIKGAWQRAGPRIKMGWQRGRPRLKRVWRVVRIPLAVLALIAGVLFFLNWNSASTWSPSWSPDGRHLLAISTHGLGLESPGRGIVMVDVTDGSSTRIGRQSIWQEPLAWSPDGTQVAFTKSGALRVMDRDGANSRVLTDPSGSPGWVIDCSWSPEGHRFAVVANGDVHILDAHSGAVRNLTESEVADSNPTWSPDGQQIAFVSDCDDNDQVCIIDAGGGNPRSLTHDAPWEKTRPCSHHGPFREESPAWSPDGQKIAAAMDLNGRFGLYLMELDASPPQLLVDGYAQFARWSPDGQQILFWARLDGARGIYVVDSDGANMRLLAGGENRVDYPIWSPDGQQIAFESSRSGNKEVYLMDADGGNLRRLTRSRRIPWLPAWPWPW